MTWKDRWSAPHGKKAQALPEYLRDGLRVLLP